MLSKLLALAVCASAVVNAAPGRGWQTPLIPQCIATSESEFTTSSSNVQNLYPPVGERYIRNLELGDGLLFESPSGDHLIDFRRIGGYAKDTDLWEIRDAPGKGERSTIWNVGTGNPIILADKLTGHVGSKATEFLITSVGYPFYTIEAPVSHKLWDFHYSEGRYPDYGVLTLAEAPTHNERISIFWKIELH
ncbi:hypothetical protein C8R43DRAFT_945896 [Mycena crocata]|nr:hypothetical protein C8R43DRAFT_945896 [Mycena crocata]